MTRLLIAMSAVLALGVFGADQASAQVCNYGGGYGGGYGGYGGGYGSGISGVYSTPRFSIQIGSSRGYSNYGGFNRGHYGYGGGVAHRTWHDTSHYDYHPPTLVPHRNHYHVIPGHYDLHQTGHWDTHYHR